ncbi:MAG: TPM domain-containing protein [Hungatella sp.]
MNVRMRIGQVFRILVVCCLMWMGSLTVWAGGVQTPSADGEPRVYDMAGLFTTEEIEGFESIIAEYRAKMKIDLVVVTTENAEGKSAQDYADDYYDQGGFGYGSGKSGVLFLIDMDNRELQISTSGGMIRLLTDRRIEKILDDVWVGADRGDFADSVDCFLQDVHSYYQKGIESGQYNYDTETGKISVHRSIRWYEVLLSILAAGIAAVTTCLGVINQYSMKKERSQAANFNMAYRADCNFAFQDQADHFLTKNVTTMFLPRGGNRPGGGMGGGSQAGRSSTHTSGGGGSHGGGGRSF